MSPIEQVITEAGGVVALANALGVKPPTVSQWKSGERPIPPRLALIVQRLYPGVANVNDLRPDIFGQPDREGEAA